MSLEDASNSLAALQRAIAQANGEVQATKKSLEELHNVFVLMAAHQNAQLTGDADATYAMLLGLSVRMAELAEQAQAKIHQAMEPGGGVPFTVSVKGTSDPAIFTGPTPFQKEHEGKDDDSTKSRLRRASRKAVKNADSFASFTKDQASSSQQYKQTFDPWGKDAKTETQQPQTPPPPTVGKPQYSDPNASDIVNTGVMVGVMAVEAASRWVERRRKKKGIRDAA